MFKSVCFNNDRATTQNTPKCVENCSDDQLSIFVRPLITSFSVTLIIIQKTVCFLVRYGTNSPVRPCALGYEPADLTVHPPPKR